jgi:acyl dehydratase
VIPGALKNMVGQSTGPVTVEVEKGQLRRFATAIGETRPIHVDEGAAKAAGYRSLVATPTFGAALIDLQPLLERLGLTGTTMMHAEEEYEYYRPVCAGDAVTLTHEVVDAYEKSHPKGNMLFVVVESRATDKGARDVFKGRRVLVEMKA